jgi:hypothetical protein
MPKLDDALLAKARQVDLVAYLQAHGHKAVYVRHHKGIFHSPLREDRNPSFAITYKDHAWKWVDFGTGEHGDGIDLLMKLHAIDFQSAVQSLLKLPVTPVAQDHGTTSAYGMTPRTVRRVYFKWKNQMTAEHEFLIRQYFLTRQLAFPEGLGLIYIERQVNHTGLILPFVGIPCPSGQPRLMTSLECRALNDQTLNKQYRRRTLGDKALWVVRRPANGILVTESILDCLAGNQLLQSRTSLCALNSTNNIDRLVPCLKQLRPSTVYLALDHDTQLTPHTDPGPQAQERAKRQLLDAGFRVVEVRHHVQAGVKDLHKLLQRDPTPISLDQLESVGHIHRPSGTRTHVGRHASR